MITYAAMPKKREAAIQAIAELQRLATAKKMLPQTELDNRCKDIGKILGQLRASERPDMGAQLEATKASLMALLAF
jgi:hypothetical protein